MAITTFPNEIILLKVGTATLVEVDRQLQSTRKRMYVAVNCKGMTDYPLFTGTGVFWDFPERFPKRFRIRASRLIGKRESARDGGTR